MLIHVLVKFPFYCLRQQFSSIYWLSFRSSFHSRSSILCTSSSARESVAGHVNRQKEILRIAGNTPWWTKVQILVLYNILMHFNLNSMISLKVHRYERFSFLFYYKCYNHEVWNVLGIFAYSLWFSHIIIFAK